MNGDMAVTNNDGGTEFRIAFPVPAPIYSGGEKRMAKASILIVEDEAIVAADLANKLGQLGYKVCGQTARGEEAIDLARDRHPDLVLMDIRLAGSMDGVEAAAHLRRECDLPVIYLTAPSDQTTLQRAKLTEPFSYILKPFAKMELATHIEMALYKHQTERRLRESEAALRKANEKLLAINETLETRVAARTADLEQRTIQLRALATQLTQAEERERLRLAQVIHDHLQQLLVGARLHLQHLSARNTAEPLNQTLLKIEHMIIEAINIGRTLTADLSPMVLYQFGLGAAFNWLGQLCQEKYDLTVTVETEPKADVEAVEVRVALYQSVRELLFNVAKHAEVKHARLQLGRLESGAMRIIVSDGGIGFDPARVRAQEGTVGGFGLFSLRERLELFGIDLTIESEPGRGSRFIIMVPPAAVVPLPPSPAVERKIRIVLADDHAVILDGLVQTLNDQPDFEVLGQAINGQQAIDLARELQPDVILMDVAMPTMDGIEATRRLTIELPRIKIIGLSMFDNKSHGDAMREAGAVDFLDKSGPFSDVIDVVRKQAGTWPPGD